MELRHLRYFLTVAETLHFGQAANRLGIAQPPLSRQIQDLESEIGTPLFYRNPRGVELTDAGAIFAQRAMQILAASDDAITEARDVGAGRGGRLVIGFVHSLAYSLLPQILPGFRERHPGIAVSLREITVNEKERAILNGDIDIGIFRPPPRHPDIANAQVNEEGFVLALPTGHPLARKRRVPVSSLIGENLILFPALRGDVGLSGTIASFLKQHGVPLKKGEEVGTIHAALGLVLAGVGITIVPESTTMVSVAGITFRPFVEATTRVASCVCWRAQDESRLVHAFRQYVHQACVALDARGRQDGSDLA
ncbi:LysR substrate-binding domain-containing protein [Lacisediminimonas profundi]|uniref:LysR substrate-binding domain-containing protein n=1 Tax=Lacisediminimonas profundi TaxID=2603856 RepID=UPI00124B2308|nr:LysR substrate-binding domain-containing protein [Lacisediminimonas profundi]